MIHTAKCPKCSGTGKVAFTVDNGICYKCEGAGFIGGTEDEIATAIAERDSRNALSKAVKSIVKYLSSNRANTLEDMAINLKGEKKEYILGAAMADLFKVAFIDNYSYVFTCENPSSWMLKNREILTGKIAIIEKIADRKIKITINTKAE
jgi:hypothetical protein